MDSTEDLHAAKEVTTLGDAAKEVTTPGDSIYGDPDVYDYSLQAWYLETSMWTTTINLIMLS